MLFSRRVLPCSPSLLLAALGRLLLLKALAWILIRDLARRDRRRALLGLLLAGADGGEQRVLAAS